MQLGSTTSMYYEHVVSLVLTCIEHQVDNNKNNSIHSTIKSSKIYKTCILLHILTYVLSLCYFTY
jgi:hypothetical protein